MSEIRKIGEVEIERVPYPLSKDGTQFYDYYLHWKVGKANADCTVELEWPVVAEAIYEAADPIHAQRLEALQAVALAVAEMGKKNGDIALIRQIPAALAHAREIGALD